MEGEVYAEAYMVLVKNACCVMILTAPMATHPVFIQCVGRIVHIGQRYDCLVIELNDLDTYNQAMALASTRRVYP
ncbi:uncharacterized protein M421DRAFT_425297 [Didymella exigua CBS 183.55]|uniref:Uncharacterized protein n=1 Tax=Didymella exigua CBS 183.55 TaxID=1150837 RepID=A0A6A5R724_9PLEO|nr:uncharacterized protein M421DRAFT_425297 [Didymella exigua CBS 183.55]KAF1923955.1 hypothetical protein M421DRAFT_425297 [Didymella exigua CBS 183.55]